MFSSCPLPTQILRVSVNTVIQQNIFKTTFTYENEYGKYGVFCSSITSSTYLVLTYYYIHVVRIVVHTYKHLAPSKYYTEQRESKSRRPHALSVFRYASKAAVYSRCLNYTRQCKYKIRI